MADGLADTDGPPAGQVALTRWITQNKDSLGRRYANEIDAAVPHPWIGRQLLGLFQQAGLHDVRVVPHPIYLSGAAGYAVHEQLNRGTIDRAMHAGQVTPGRVAACWEALEQAKDAGTFFAANLGFIATGRKPWERDG
jgi:hypothetical protein